VLQDTGAYGDTVNDPIDGEFNLDTYENSRNDPDGITAVDIPIGKAPMIKAVTYTGTNDKTISAADEAARNTALAAKYQSGEHFNQLGVDEVGSFAGAVDAPTVPGLATPIALSKTVQRVNFTWAPNATIIYIEKSLNGSSWGTPIEVTAGTFYKDFTGLTAATLYYYRARAWNSAGYSSYSAVVADTTRVSNGVEQALWSTFKTKMQADTYLSTYVTTWQFSREATIFPESAFPVFKAWIIDTAEDWKGVPKSKIVKPRVIIHALVKTATAVLLETEKLKADEYIKNALEADMTFAGGVTMNIVGDTIFSNKDDTTAEIFITCEILSSRFTAGAR
jgi:hypothetical protein